MANELQSKIRQYKDEYLNTPDGQAHLATVESEAQEVKQVMDDLRRKYAAGADITNAVLTRLLPHSDTKFHQENGQRISTWPCIIKDVRSWFEGAGWKKPEDWEPTARLIFEAVDSIINGKRDGWNRFLASEYRYGFGTGFISPILFCLDEQYPVINSKVVKTYRYCMQQLGEPDEIDAKLDSYFENAGKVRALQQRLLPYGLKDIREFDIFCHYNVSKRLGGNDISAPAKTESKFAAWFFVANPEIFNWDQAFAEGGVDWTGSKGAFAQKLLRQQMHKGDRVFGYQAGPYYEVNCELKVGTEPYRTPDGTWAANLVPVRRLETPIPLSVLKNHPILSTLKFVQQTQISISGITPDQRNRHQ